MAIVCASGSLFAATLHLPAHVTAEGGPLTVDLRAEKNDQAAQREEGAALPTETEATEAKTVEVANKVRKAVTGITFVGP